MLYSIIATCDISQSRMMFCYVSQSIKDCKLLTVDAFQSNSVKVKCYKQLRSETTTTKRNTRTKMVDQFLVMAAW